MSNRRYFGTDGIRGEANTAPMTADVAMKVAMATAVAFKETSNARRRVVIGKDTRISGYMLEQAMTSGFLAMGLDVLLLGPLPTPGVAMLTRSLRADLGVMISASHNAYQDNGIKLFGADGFKLSDEIELQIEAHMDEDLSEHYPKAAELGRASRLDDAVGRYIEFVKNTFPKGLNLSGLKIVVDCANGAAYKVAPQVLWELEADVIPIFCQPNGYNINERCGATNTEALEKAVIEYGADLGIALDGDADRLIMVDEKGQKIDGDQLMALIASAWQKSGMITGGGIAATVMSNLGLERYLEEQGLKLERTAVGDRYVVEAMREKGLNIGGEQSGHLVLTDYSTTGDGLIAALQVLSVIKQTGEKVSSVTSVFPTVPQLLRNVRYSGGSPLERADVKDAIKGSEIMLNGQGRLLVRASGTEPLIRVMAEGDDQDLVEKAVASVCQVIQK